MPKHGPTTDAPALGPADLAVVASAIRGDASAVESLWHAHRGWIAAAVLAPVVRDDDIDRVLDLIDERMRTEIRHLRDPGSFQPWLQAIASNVAAIEGKPRPALNVRPSIAEPIKKEEFAPEQAAELKVRQLARREWQLLVAKNATAPSWEFWSRLAVGEVEGAPKASSSQDKAKLLPNDTTRDAFWRYDSMRDAYLRLRRLEMKVALRRLEETKAGKAGAKAYYLDGLFEAEGTERRDGVDAFAAVLRIGAEFHLLTGSPKEIGYSMARHALLRWYARVLQFEALLGHDGPVTETTEEKKPTKPPRDVGSVELGRSFEAALRGMVARLAPPVRDEDIEYLATIIREARVHPISDKAAFVRDVNQLLDVLSLRIQTDDGELGRLALNNVGSITISRAEGGTRGFKRAALTLVPVPRVRVGNRFTASPEP